MFGNNGVGQAFQPDVKLESLTYGSFWPFALRSASHFGLLVCLSACLLVFLSSVPAAAQVPQGPRYIRNLSPAGGRSNLTDTWGVLRFGLWNPTDHDMEARLLTFYPTAQGRQYGRDVWIPARATLWSWLCIGPPPDGPVRSFQELQSLLYNRTGEGEKLLRSADGQPLHSDLVGYYRREPGTTIMMDMEIVDGSRGPPSPREETQANEVRDLVRVFRERLGVSERLGYVRQRFLPPVPEALEGVDHFVLGTNRIAEDSGGQLALRAWLRRGGTLWVMLDLVEPATVATLLGDELDLEVVDRVSLTHIQVRGGPANPHRADTEARDLEEPVELVRVLAPGQQVLYMVDGWPAAFLKDVGRGRVLFTTLGPRGWMRPRTARDPQSRLKSFPQLPMPLLPFQFLVTELEPKRERPALATDDLRRNVIEQIGYSVARRGTVLSVFGVFFLVLMATIVALGRRRLLEHIGWLGPALALATTGVFVGLGEHSRGAVPATVATLQLIDALPGLDEVQATGYLAVYQPSRSTADVGAEQYGSFDLDMAGLEGRVHRRIQTDMDQWHWEDLELPSGVRTAPFHRTVPLSEPMAATARFGPQGIEGRLLAGPFLHLEDALLCTPNQQPLSIHLGTDNSFRAGPEDVLAPGQWLASGLLNDQQRIRHDLYAKLLGEPRPHYLAQHNLLLAWADSVDMHFKLAPDARRTGSALLLMPLRFERTPPGTPVVVPAAFVDSHRIYPDGRAQPPKVEGRDPARVRLRFGIPDAVRPLTVERARVFLDLSAPSREVMISAVVGTDTAVLRNLTSPLGVEPIDIDEPRLLRTDDQGALYVEIAISALRGSGQGQDVWRLQSAGLEIHGRTQAEK